MPTPLRRAAIAGLAIVFSLAAVAFATPAMAEEAAVPTGYKVKNQEAVQKLSQMSRDEVDALDARISEALTRYYDQKYAAALPIFQDVAKKVETMDIMFWIGTSAARSDKLELAREQYQKMLQIDPSLDRVRLELATVYFAMGEVEAARKELATVKAGNPPAQVLASIAKLETAMDESSRKYAWNVQATAGWIWDDNITAGPDPGVYTLPGGSTFTPAPSSSKIRDDGFLATATGNVLYDAGARGGFMWNTGANVYSKTYKSYGEYDYLAANLYTGPWWARRDGIVKVPFNFTNTYYGSDRLSYLMSVDPSYEHFFSRMFSLRAAYMYKDERFYQESVAANLDNISNIVELAPTFYFQNRSHILTGRIGYDHHMAKNHVYAYYAPYAALSYFTRFSTQTELYLAYQWTQRDYAGVQPFPYNGLMRHDKRNYYTASVSQPFMKHFYASYAFAYTDNQSNLELYTWDKTTHTISVGCKF
ncbi:MAG: porin family protein [Pseudomonadota bacterium]